MKDHGFRERMVVESKYRSRWKGIILKLDVYNKDRVIATVRQTVDKRGKPIRNQKKVQLHIYWLNKVTDEETWFQAFDACRGIDPYCGGESRKKYHFSHITS
jgi:hypothetical protein